MSPAKKEELREWTVREWAALIMCGIAVASAICTSVGGYYQSRADVATLKDDMREVKGDVKQLMKDVAARPPQSQRFTTRYPNERPPEN